MQFIILFLSCGVSNNAGDCLKGLVSEMCQVRHKTLLCELVIFILYVYTWLCVHFLLY